MSKWNIEDTLSEADGEYISKEEVCTDCPKNIGDCEFWNNCSRAYILGKRWRKEYEKNEDRNCFWSAESKTK